MVNDFLFFFQFFGGVWRAPVKMREKCTMRGAAFPHPRRVRTLEFVFHVAYYLAVEEVDGSLCEGGIAL